ncbi:MAG: DNA-processing protein DprA [Oscillospiraceae bacterium]|nr:DNA-processing protein DprA [Oscillospiraceae bacterium]
MNNVEVWLWILLVMLPHNSRTSAIISRYGSALEAARAMRDGRCDDLSEAEKQRVERTRTREVRSLISECERLGIRIVTMDDEEYPEALKTIQDPPVVLFVKGDLKPLKDRLTLSVVGPRSPSEYSRKAADVICTELVEDGCAIVSGLAVGIDAVAHRCAVNKGGYTIGVMGCGLMVNYPTENAELKNAILESGGALISELLPYTSVSAGYFKRRNRIISGIAAGTLVVEASSRSGCLLTAEHTVKQGRSLFCIPPHDIFEERYDGSAELIRAGAVSVFATTDIYEELSGAHEGVAQLSEKRKAAPKPAAPKPKIASVTAKKIEKPAVKAAEKNIEPDISQLSPEEGQIVLLLREKPLTMDELIDKTEKKHDEICSVVLGLELMDVILRNQDGTFSLR